MTKPKNKIWLIAFLTVMILTGLVWYAYFVQYPKIKQMAEDIQKEKLNALVQEEKSKRMLNIRNEFDEMEQQKKEIDGAFVGEPNVVNFLETLEEIASKTGNVIKIDVYDLKKLIKQAPTKDPEDDDEKNTAKKQGKTTEKNQQQTQENFENKMGFTIELEGNFKSLLDFIYQIENISYFVQIRTLDSYESTRKINKTANQQGGSNAASSNEKVYRTSLIIIVNSK